MQDLDDNDPTEGMEEGSPEFFDASIDAMEEVRDAAPDEIKGDVESMLAGFEELSEVDPANLEEADFAELQERLTELGESADRVETFIDTNCEE